MDIGRQERGGELRRALRRIDLVAAVLVVLAYVIWDQIAKLQQAFESLPDTDT